MLFTENETNFHTLYGSNNLQPFVKDAFHRHIVHHERGAINPRNRGSKLGCWYAFDEDDGVPPGECAVVRFRISKKYEGYLDEEWFDEVRLSYLFQLSGSCFSGAEPEICAGH